MDTIPTANLPAIPEDNNGRQAFWTRHVENWRRSDLPQTQYAREHQMPLARFTYWKNKLYPSNEPSEFVQVNIEPSVPVRMHHHSGTVIECAAGTDVIWLRALLGLRDAS